MGLKPDGRGTINKNHAFGTYHILKMGLKVLAMCLHQSHFKIGFLLIPNVGYLKMRRGDNEQKALA